MESYLASSSAGRKAQKIEREEKNRLIFFFLDLVQAKAIGFVIAVAKSKKSANYDRLM
jgi:hypothetical protein